MLLVVAAPAEARAVLAARPNMPTTAWADGIPPEWRPVPIAPALHVVLSGVGKSNAAGATGTLVNPEIHGAVLSVGVAGALPGSGLAPGAVVVADRCVHADEGIETGEGFQSAESMGFPPCIDAQHVQCSDDLVERLRPVADAVGAIATVSTCSGTDARARAVEHRTGALAESMEGAAVVSTAIRRGVVAGELRVISNTTGDRAGQVWDLARALESLVRVVAQL